MVSTTFRFHCPACHATVEATASLAGRQMECPQCRRMVAVPNWRGAQPARAAQQNVSPQYHPAGSTPPPLPPEQGQFNGQDMLNHWAGKALDLAGLDRPVGFSPREFLSSVFTRHTDEEMEQYFTVGSTDTTPELMQIDSDWPKPWAFARALAFSLFIYFGMVMMLEQFQNPKLLPGVILTGSFAVPLSMVIFFWESNAPRNISLYQVVKLFFLGGILSLFLSLFLFQVIPLHEILGAPAAGPIEEAGKLAALVLVARQAKYRHTLNGMLMGATVGAGFAAFESAGYALESLVSGVGFFGVSYDVSGMLELIQVRGLLSPLSHIVWTAMAGAALWRVKGGQPFQFAMLSDWRFLRVFALCVGLHFLWNTQFQLPFYGKYAILGAFAWVVIIGLMHTGLTEIREQQRGQRARMQTVYMTN